MQYTDSQRFRGLNVRPDTFDVWFSRHFPTDEAIHADIDPIGVYVRMHYKTVS
jgi:hypothetical protein